MINKMTAAIDAATAGALSNGNRVMQTHYFGGGQLAHVTKLLKWMNPPPGAHIVDAGSGVGEIALLMQAIRPDLTFTLVNISEYQHSLSPSHNGFARVLGDFTVSGLPDGCADVVMFNSALCQMPINRALSEARRLLVDGGQLFVSDLSIDEYRELPELYATFMPGQQWQEVIGRHGFELALLVNDEPCDMGHFAGAFGDAFELVMPGAAPLLVSYTKRSESDWLRSTVERHQKVAFQFSGGKDSLATLYLMRELWPLMTVYWTNTGDAVPEVLAVIERVRAEVPHFVEIAGRVIEQIENHGLPSDIVPTTSTAFGIDAYGSGVPLQDRFQCCSAALMLPMHEQMRADGVTLIIRGQKSSDTLKSALRSGAVSDGIELLFPLEHWTDAQVFDWLRLHAFVPDYYEDLAASPDCLTCSAYWSEGRAAWLKAKHPSAYAEYQRKLDVIRGAVMPHIALFNLEVV